MGCIPFTATVLSHHARLYYTLLHTPLRDPCPDSLSAKPARLQREVPCMRIGHKLTPEGYVPYAVREENMLKAVGVHSRIDIGRGDLASPRVCFPATARPHDVAGAVAILRRSVRYRLATQAAPGSGSNDASQHEHCWHEPHESMQRPKNSMLMRRASPRSGRSESIYLSKVGSDSRGVVQ